MKKFLAIIGGIFLVFLVIGTGVFGYIALQGQGLDISSREYIEANIPPIISTWSAEALLQRSSPALIKIFNENPQKLQQFFTRNSKMGTMKSFDNIKGEAFISYKSGLGRIITASYKGIAKFENGEANVNVQLIQINGE